MTDSTMHSLMLALGPVTTGVEAVVEHSPGQWAILLADGGEVTAELDDEASAIAFTLPVAAPAASERRRVYEAALLYNSLWRETAGTRLAMAGESGIITVGLELPVAALDLAALQDVLALLADRAETWHEVIRGQSAPDDRPEARIYI